MNEKPNCPKCDAVDVVKNGKTRGKQRVKCKNCNFQFTSLVPRGYPPETKAKVIELYNHGLSIRAAARLQGVSRSSALNWIKEFAKKKYMKNLLPDPLFSSSWTKCGTTWGQRRTNCGYGKPIGAKLENSWIGNVALVTRRHYQN